MLIQVRKFGELPDGSEISLFTLSDKSGFAVSVTNWGATIISILAPDNERRFQEVVLGYDHLEPYLANPAYFGSTIGRYCNRIADARFQLEGAPHTLTANEGRHHLHGGQPGFSHRPWKAQVQDDAVAMYLKSEHGDQGYPGNLQLTVRFYIGSQHDLHIDYEATSDQATILNLTNHSYFNLSGDAHADTREHRLRIDAPKWLPNDPEHIPTGETLPTAGNPCDFREEKPIGDAPFNHYFLLENHNRLKTAAQLSYLPNGRTLEVLTDQPGLMLYNGFGLDEPKGRDGKAYRPFDGVCLETQRPANAPNQPTFPTTSIHATDTFHSKTIYRFQTTT